jgi:hypothetical protein
VPFRSVDDAWDEIVATLELGSGLRFVIAETQDQQAAALLRQRLDEWLLEHGQTLASPADGENVLDWLSVQQWQSSNEGLPDVVRWLPLPEGYDGKFVLHRLNEGRDNLRRNLRGVIFLVGGPGLVPRLANEAPDLWSVREKVLEIESPAHDGSIERAAPEMKPMAQPSPEYSYDVFLSYSDHDINTVEKLTHRLERDGIKFFALSKFTSGAPIDNFAAAIMLKCRFLAPLLSPNYMRSGWTMWELDLWLARHHRALQSGVIPIMIQDTVVPGALRALSYLDGRTQQSMDAAYAKLLRILREARKA